MRFGSCRGASSNSSWIEPSDHNSNPQASRYGATKMLLLDAARVLLGGTKYRNSYAPGVAGIVKLTVPVVLLVMNLGYNRAPFGSPTR